MRRCLLWALLPGLWAFTAFGQRSSEDEAGDVSEVDKDASGPLRDRVRPVSGHLFLMNQRLEVSPGIGLSLRDAFWQKVGFGAVVTYHLTEELGVSARFSYNLSLVSGAAQICDPVGGGCAAPTVRELTTFNGQTANVAFGYMTLLSGLDFQWAPLYGKLALFSETILNFNMYAAVGPSFLIYGPNNVFAVGGNIGIGFRFFLNEWLTVRLEVRDVLYQEEGYDRKSTRNQSFRNQLMTELGISMFFPTLFREEG